MRAYADAKSDRRGFHAVTIGRLACCAAGLLAVSSPLSAHHSFSAEFDATRQIKVTGEVAELEWTNPHAWVHVVAREICERRGSANLRDTSSDEPWSCRTVGEDEVAQWGFELASPNGLMRQGWNRNSLKPGETVTVEGSRARDNSNNGNARTVTRASDGVRLFAGSSQNTTP